MNLVHTPVPLTRLEGCTETVLESGPKAQIGINQNINKPLCGRLKGMRRLLLLSISVFLMLMSCVPLTMQPEKLRQKWLPFLQEGSTTKEDVLLELGIPSAQFQGDRILAYRLTDVECQVYSFRHCEKEGLVTIDMLGPEESSGWRAAWYNLILVFDENDVLKKLSLIGVRRP